MTMKMRMRTKTKEKFCELCNQRAFLYCAADSAFLCRKCDAAVHHANFLVARHRRHLLCSDCNRFTGIRITGSAPPHLNGGDGGGSPACRSCSPPPPENPPADDENAGLLSSPSSSACVSSSHQRNTETEKRKPKQKRENAQGKRIRARSCSSTVTDEEASSSAANRKRRRRNGDGSGGEIVDVAEKEEVFEKWIGELGLGQNDGDCDCVVSLASKALSLCLERWKSVVPFKVAAATSFWFGLRFCGICGFATCQNLWRLEVISGVPAKLILHAHAKLARVFHERRFLNLQEGCDES